MKLKKNKFKKAFISEIKEIKTKKLPLKFFSNVEEPKRYVEFVFNFKES